MGGDFGFDSCDVALPDCRNEVGDLFKYYFKYYLLVKASKVNEIIRNKKKPDSLQIERPFGYEAFSLEKR